MSIPEADKLLWEIAKEEARPYGDGIETFQEEPGRWIGVIVVEGRTARGRGETSEKARENTIWELMKMFV